jgi:hypothetical protein
MQINNSEQEPCCLDGRLLGNGLGCSGNHRNKGFTLLGGWVKALNLVIVPATASLGGA